MAFRLMAGRLVFVVAVFAVPAVQNRTSVVWAQQQPVVVSFDRDIRPILSDLCFTCHGPDEAQRSSQLRLDQRAGLFSERDGGRVVSPGKPSASLLVQRIVSADPDVQMPPPEFQRRLTDRQKRLLSDWIEQGAKWTEHWAFVRPQVQTLPRTGNPGWCRNPIDQFVGRAQADRGLHPLPEADRRTLLRRLTFDLTGLPPTPAEVDAFLADTSPHAYERVVDRLLESPHYGEHAARHWLDLVRYAESTANDANAVMRFAWRYRNYVIDAFNRDLPYDQFLIEQLAGDLLTADLPPGPAGQAERLRRTIATGFLMVGP